MKNKDGKTLPEIPMGLKVHTGVWEFRYKIELLMLSVFVKSYETAPLDPMTGNRKGKLPMQVNPN